MVSQQDCVILVNREPLQPIPIKGIGFLLELSKNDCEKTRKLVAKNKISSCLFQKRSGNEISQTFIWINSFKKKEIRKKASKTLAI